MNALDRLLSTLRLLDGAAVFDILLVATIIYYLLALAKGTRAMQVLKGVAVLLAVMKGAQWLGLETLQWIIGQAVFASALAFVILFQPELRAALDHLGRGYFDVLGLRFSRAGDIEDARIATEVARAVSEMSSRRIGALIALERATGLDDLAQTGTLMNARLSAEVLEAVFYPGNPLHDGAAIISGPSILAVGCVLPLSQNDGLPRSVGTRHRAALGLSESTDAVIVVVSEETGNVSVARDGTMTSILQGRLLADELTSLMSRSEGAARLRPFARSAQAVSQAALFVPRQTGRAWGSVRQAMKKG